MSYESPPVLRPIPRRPFDISLISATPPESDPSTPPRRSSSSNHLDARPSNGNLSAYSGGADTPNISRTRSILNLTSSTLFGIYSPTYTERSENDTGTPFGTGALTPLSTAGSGAPTRPRVMRARSSQSPSQNSLPLRLVGLSLRSSLLFLLGTAYGLLVTHLHNEQSLAPFAAEGIIKPSYDARYLVFWGVAGVLMGSALPWVDDMWEEFIGEDASNAVTRKGGEGQESEDEGVAAQWTPVVRSIGAFVGIAFAIRKLPWTSTLQVSLTLALVNPFLWYLLDRSKPGFLLSTAVGMVGTTGILALDSSIVPNPLASSTTFNNTGASGKRSSGLVGAGKSQIESAVWIMSVLFCSVLCFGHIGRRLALLRRKARQS